MKRTRQEAGECYTVTSVEIATALGLEPDEADEVILTHRFGNEFHLTIKHVINEDVEITVPDPGLDGILAAYTPAIGILLPPELGVTEAEIAEWQKADEQVAS